MISADRQGLLTNHELGPSGKETPSVWWRDLGLVHWDDHGQDTNGPTGNESTSNEHTDVDSGSL